MSVFKRLFMAIVLGLAIAAMAVPTNAAMTQTITDRPNAYWYSGNYTRDYAWIWAQEVETIIEACTLESGYLTMTEGAIIDNETATEITFTEDDGSGDEDITWDFVDNGIDISSSTGVVKLDYGAIVLASTHMLFTPVSADPTGAVEGEVYYDSDVDKLYVRKTAGLTELCQQAGAATTLDSGYDSGGAGLGKKIEVDTGGIELEVDDGSTSSTYALLLDYDDVTNNNPVLMIENAGSGNSIDIEGTSGNDIEGSGDTWSVTTAGAATFVSGTIPTLTVATSLTASLGLTLGSGDTLKNTVDTEFLFTDTGGENFSIDMDAAANAIGLKSGSGVDELQLGAIDDLTGVGTIVFDAAASTITHTSTADSTDFTIAQAGSKDSSLFFTSAGTAADAMGFATSAGGMDFTVAGAAGGAPIIGVTNAARNVWVNATPSANWDTLTTGRYAVLITYLDLGAVYTHDSP